MVEADDAAAISDQRPPVAGHSGFHGDPCGQRGWQHGLTVVSVLGLEQVRMLSDTYGAGHPRRVWLEERLGP